MKRELLRFSVPRIILWCSLIIGIFLLFGIVAHFAVNKDRYNNEVTNPVEILEEKQGERRMTYTNEEYAFEFQYPWNYYFEQGDYSLNSGSDSRGDWFKFADIKWKNQGVYNPSLIVDVIKTDLSLQEYLNETADEGSMVEGTCEKEAVYCSLKNQEDIYVGDQEISALRFESVAMSGGDVHTFIKNGGYIIDIRAHSSGIGTFSEEVYEEILSTFKFIKKEQNENEYISEIEDGEVLHIDWLSEIVEEPLEKFFTEEQLNTFDKECYDYDSENPSEKVFCYSFYKAGTVNSGKYEAYDYYLVSKTFCGNGCSDYYYRIIFNPSDGRLILLEKYSNEPDDKRFFTRAKNIAIDNLLPKTEIPIPDSEYFLEKHSESPNMFFESVIKTSNSSIDITDMYEKIFTDSEAGDIYLDKNKQTFMVRVNDGSLVVYRINLPFIKNQEDREGSQEYGEEYGMNIDDLLLDIEFTDGKQNEEFYAHGSRYQYVCAGGQMYDLLSDDYISDFELKLAGTSFSGEEFYEIGNQEKLREIYEEHSTAPYLVKGLTSYTSYVYYGDLSFEEFESVHPLLFWKDPFGRWIQFTNNIFSPLLECGGGYGMSAL